MDGLATDRIGPSASPSVGVFFLVCTSLDAELSKSFRGLGHPRALVRVWSRHYGSEGDAAQRRQQVGMVG